jgi:DNA-binding transcriptional LysR family regulator
MSINDVDVRALRRFVAVAEDRSFSRAAVRLGLAQPPLSRAIRELESAIGASLLVRTTRSVELTAAGRVLLEEARVAIAAVEAAARRASRAATRAPRLVVAVKPGGTRFLDEIIRRYEARGDVPKAKAMVAGWGEQAAMLADGRADVALLRCPVAAPPSIDFEVLFVEPRVVALPTSHRLAKRRLLRRAELSGEPVPVWPPADAELAAYRAGVDSPAALASVPSGPPVHDLSQMLEAVALGQGIAFLPRSTAAQSRHHGVVFVPVRDIAPSKGGVAWPASSKSRATAYFVRAAVEVAGRTRHVTDLA